MDGLHDPSAPSLVPVSRLGAPPGQATGTDALAREEPLEIRIGRVPVAVLMRTPGHDEDLVRGFLRTEGIVDDPSWIVALRHCDQVTTPEAEDNVMRVVLRPDVQVDVAALRRNLYASSSCGVCGKASIERAMALAPPLTDGATVAAAMLHELPARLRERQPTFATTGGSHAAGLFSAAGEPIVVREDVGRHNAVDKVVGWALRARLPPQHAPVLLVSGRVSFEIVQKAAAARIPVVAAVSAPTSLAVRLAESVGVGLAAFVREQRLSIYATARRFRP